jgi:hypothetical protein
VSHRSGRRAKQEPGAHQHPLDPLTLQVALRARREGAEPLLQAECMARGGEHVVIRLGPPPQPRDRDTRRCVLDLGPDPLDVRGLCAQRGLARLLRRGLDQVQCPADSEGAIAAPVPLQHYPQHRQDGDDHADLDEQGRIHYLMTGRRPARDKTGRAARDDPASIDADRALELARLALPAPGQVAHTARLRSHDSGIVSVSRPRRCHRRPCRYRGLIPLDRVGAVRSERSTSRATSSRPIGLS